MTVQVSILTDEQAEQHFDVDLGRREIQALWIRVSNGSRRRLWLIRNVLDPDFYSAEEVAALAQTEVGYADRERLRQYLRDESIRVQLAPRTVTEGFIFLPRARGGRYVDLRLQADAYAETRDSAAATPGADAASVSRKRELRFGFAIPLPDGDFDYERLDPNGIYAADAMPDLSVDELRAALEGLQCCATDAEGKGGADPLNIVLVGDSHDMMNSLSRSGWSFTHRITAASVRHVIGAAIGGTPYPVAPVSDLYAFGRKQDIALQRARRSIAQRNHMRLWLAPFRAEGRWVWVGQVSRDIGIKLTTASPTLTTHVIDPEVDATREYLLHSLMAHGFVDRFGFVKGGPAVSRTEPRYNLTGDPYFSDGMRLVVFLSPEPVRADRVRSLLWEESAAPIAEGQSEAAGRRVWPIEPEAHDAP